MIRHSRVLVALAFVTGVQACTLCEAQSTPSFSVKQVIQTNVFDGYYTKPNESLIFHKFRAETNEYLFVKQGKREWLVGQSLIRRENVKGVIVKELPIIVDTLVLNDMSLRVTNLTTMVTNKFMDMPEVAGKEDQILKIDDEGHGRWVDVGVTNGLVLEKPVKKGVEYWKIGVVVVVLVVLVFVLKRRENL